MANGNNWNPKTRMYEAIEDHRKFKNNVVLGNVSKCPHCKSDDVSDIEGIMWCSGCDSTY